MEYMIVTAANQPAALQPIQWKYSAIDDKLSRNWLRKKPDKPAKPFGRVRLMCREGPLNMLCDLKRVIYIRNTPVLAALSRLNSGVGAISRNALALRFSRGNPELRLVL